MNDDNPIYDKIKYKLVKAETPKPWHEKVKEAITPNTRRWAYGLTAAAIIAGATWAGKPEFIPVAIPLAMAIWYVDDKGEPK